MWFMVKASGCGRLISQSLMASSTPSRLSADSGSLGAGLAEAWLPESLDGRAGVVARTGGVGDTRWRITGVVSVLFVLTCCPERVGVAAARGIGFQWPFCCAARYAPLAALMVAALRGVAWLSPK